MPEENSFLQRLKDGLWKEIPVIRGMIESSNSQKDKEKIKKIYDIVNSLNRQNCDDIRDKISMSKQDISDEEIIRGIQSFLSYVYVQDYKFINLVDTIELSKQIQTIIMQSGKNLANKYLYLGAQGASAWKKVEKALSIKTVASELLRDNFGDILNIALDMNNTKNFDIVSLGSGTGGDDIEILQALHGSCNESQSSFFAVDISVDLLRLGIDNIIQYTKSNGFNEMVDFHGLCLDIENLPSMKNYLSQNSNNNNRFFHLLGLTLGNNKEFNFLASISQAMRTNDFLLIGLDFSLDEKKLLKNTIKSYEDARLEVLEFLSGPLRVATRINASKPSQKIMFEGTWSCSDHYDYLTKHFRIDFKPERGDRIGLSNIPGTVTLSRYYAETNCKKSNRDNSKLCDISNKYNSNYFETWLENVKSDLHLELASPIKNWGRKGQYLVLLRRQ